MLADSHTHVLDPRIADRAEEIVLNMPADGLAFIVEISASPREAVDALVFAEKYNNVYCTAGVHPHVAGEYSIEFEHWLKSKKGNSKIVAVGECGLDYYRLENSKELQKEVFTRQIKLADELSLPLAVHTREAFEDTMQLLVKNKRFIRNGILFHCFSESADEVVRITEQFDAYFAFGGAITYKGNKISAGAIQAVSLNRILVETDSPYLSPEPLRGRVNEPKNVKITAERIARILNLTTEEVEKITLENTKRFYRIKN